MTVRTTAAAPDASGSAAGAWIPPAPALARSAAVERLSGALQTHGMTGLAAGAVARAAVRPDQVRRRLEEPVELRVPGGILLVVESSVWTPMISPYPTNPREMGQRLYPLGLPNADSDGLLDEPVQSRRYHGELTLSVQRPKQLADRLRNAEAWLVNENDLRADIRTDGILQPVTLVALTIRHRDRSSAVALLSAADGSSRISSAHRLLGLDPADLIYNDRADRELRQLIGRIVRSADPDSSTDGDLQALRVLTAPARIVIGYRPDEGSSASFDQAVRGLIGLTHIRPPKPYGRAVERDALGDAVLAALASPSRTRSRFIDDTVTRWFAGRISQTELHDAGLPSEPDVRAATIVWNLVAGDRRRIRRVNDGIRDLTAQLRPSPLTRVDVAVELILRTVRTEHASDAKYAIQTRRAAMQRAYRLPELAALRGATMQEGLDGSLLTLVELRNEALEELRSARDDDRLLPAQTELAVKAAYYMIVAEPSALRREVAGRDDDDETDERALSVVLRAMLNSERGIRQAYAVVKAGRSYGPLQLVSERGRFVVHNGHRVTLTDSLVRSTFTGAPHVGAPTVGAVAAGHAWTAVTRAVTTLQEAVKEMSEILDESGVPFVENHGWTRTEVRDARDRIDVVDRRLGSWADRHAGA
jgi:hypothetical protein